MPVPAKTVPVTACIKPDLTFQAVQALEFYEALDGMSGNEKPERLWGHIAECYLAAGDVPAAAKTYRNVWDGRSSQASASVGMQAYRHGPVSLLALDATREVAES